MLPPFFTSSSHCYVSRSTVRALTASAKRLLSSIRTILLHANGCKFRCSLLCIRCRSAVTVHSMNMTRFTVHTKCSIGTFWCCLTISVHNSGMYSDCPALCLSSAGCFLSVGIGPTLSHQSLSFINHQPIILTGDYNIVNVAHNLCRVNPDLSLHFRKFDFDRTSANLPS